MKSLQQNHILAVVDSENDLRNHFQEAKIWNLISTEAPDNSPQMLPNQ